MANNDLKATLVVVGVDEVLAAIGNLTKQQKTDFRKDMAKQIRPTAAIIKQTVPTQGQVVHRGMVHAGRTRWSPVRTTIRFHAKSRKPGYGYKPLLQIDVTGSPGGLGFDYAELAGASKRRPRTRTKEFSRMTKYGQTQTYTRINNHGDQFIQSLKDKFPMRAKAGRFAYQVFIQERPALEAAAFKVMETYAAKVNRKIASR